MLNIGGIMQEIIIQVFFGIELIALQFVIYAMLYPTRHRKIVENREKIIMLGSLTALAAGILSCIASGHIAFFKWEEPLLISEKVTFALFYIVCLSALLVFFLAFISRTFHLDKGGKSKWSHICKEDIQLYEDFSRGSVLNETKMTGDWTTGGNTYRILFRCPVLKEDMLAELIQKNTFTFICNKVVLLGEPTGQERLLTMLCIVARYMFFVSTWSANEALYEQNDALFSQNLQTMLLSTLMLGSAWALLYGLKSRTDLHGTCIRILFYVLLAVSLVVMPFFEIRQFYIIPAVMVLYTRCKRTDSNTENE